jgi:hypothetical protein
MRPQVPAGVRAGFYARRMTDTPSPTFGRTGRLPDHTPEHDVDDVDQVDPDLEPVARRSSLEELADELETELNAELEAEVETLPVPGRPGYAVRYECAIEYDQLVAWQKRATVGKGQQKRVHELKFGRIVLGNLCRGIVRRGELILENGTEEPLTFSSKAFQELVGAASAVEAVQRLYGRDINVINATADVMARAGYDGEGYGADAFDDELGEVRAPTPT